LAAAAKVKLSCWDQFVGAVWQTPAERGASDRMRAAIERARIAKLNEALDLGLKGSERGKKNGEWRLRIVKCSASKLLWTLDAYSASNRAFGWKECTAFCERVYYLRDQIERLAKGGKTPEGLDLKTVDEVRAYLSGLLSDPVYQALKDQDVALVNFLQILCIKLSRADGRPAFRQYSRDVALSDPEHHALDDLAPAMGNRLTKFWAHSRDGIGGKILWGATHRKAVSHSVKSQRKPLKYNSHKRNPSFLGHEFERNDGGSVRRMQFVWGPGITGDDIAEHGLLPAYKKFRIREIRFNYQDTHVPHEFHRIRRAVEISAKPGYEGRLNHVLLGFETKAGHASLKKASSVEEFISSYRDMLKSDFRQPPASHGKNAGSGVYIPQDFLSDGEIETILVVARDLLKLLGVDAALQDKEFRKEARRAALFVLDGMISSALLYKQMGKLRPESEKDPAIDDDLQTDIVTAACKQGIDRGPVQANGLRLFYRWMTSDEPLSFAEFEEIAGSTLGRARIVEGRNILFKKYSVFDTFLRMASNGKSKAIHVQMDALRRSL
jgi:hypothetical protein